MSTYFETDRVAAILEKARPGIKWTVQPAMTGDGYTIHGEVVTMSWMQAEFNDSLVRVIGEEMATCLGDCVATP